ncbi:MAG: hypothetical protein ACKVU0_12885 [Saprospiraceae bacterium]
MSIIKSKIYAPLNSIRASFLIFGSIIWVLSLIFLIWPETIIKDEYILNYIKAHDKINDYLINLSAALLCGLVITLTWNKIEEAFGIIKDEELLQEFRRTNKEFRLVPVESAFALATKYITNCLSIRAIGTAQQDHRSPSIQEAIDRYLNETIKRLNNRVVPVKYRRISNINLNEKFNAHIQKVFDEKNVSKHEIEMIFYNQFTPFYTYLIIDEKFMMLSINHPPGCDSYCEYCLICENRDVIELFKTQFQKIFDKEREIRMIVKNKQGFERCQTFDKIIYSELDTIVKGIEQIPDMNENYKKFILPEINQIQKNITRLSEQRLKINHTFSNGNLLAIFCKYMDGLQKDDQYTTITFFEFWQDIVNKGKREPDFIESNTNALKRGAKISRLLVLDEEIIRKISHLDSFTHQDVVSNIMEMTYYFGIQKVIKLNLKMLLQYPDNYTFEILISKRHGKLRQNYFNFAILKIRGQENEKILFEPSNTAQIESTTILFYTNKYPTRHQAEFEEKERQLSEIKQAWETQNCAGFKKFFIEVDSKFFGNNENQLKLFGQLLND